MNETNYISDKKLIGGMISSAGFAQQDLVAIKYLFDSLDDGLEAISFETKEDFVLHYKDKKQILCQSKINELTPKSVVKFMDKYKNTDELVIIGSSMDDSFRNLINKRDRYINAKKISDDASIYNDFKNVCDEFGINIDQFLKYSFDAIESNHAKELARESINKYAEKKGIFICSEELLLELAGIISIDLRSKGGCLSINEIKLLITKHRTEKIPSIYKSDPIISDYIKIKVIDNLEELIQKHKIYSDKLSIIKTLIENNQYLNAKNFILEIYDDAEWIRPYYFWVLNMLGYNDEKNRLIEGIDIEKIDDSLLFSIAVHFYLNKDYNAVLKYLDKMKNIEFPEYYMLMALYYTAIHKKEEALENVKKCINIDNSFADAYILLADLIKEKDPKEAVENLKKAISLDAQNPQIQYELAIISEQCDDFTQSTRYFKKYIELSQTDNIRMLVKIPVYMHYTGDPNWEAELFKIKRHLDKIEHEQSTKIHYCILPKDLINCAFYTFIYNTNDGCFLYRDSECIFKSVENNLYFGLGVFSSPSNHFLINASEEMFTNPARELYDEISEKELSPSIFIFVGNDQKYKDIVDELINTKHFVLNHDYGDGKEYIDRNRAVFIKLNHDKTKVNGEIGFNEGNKKMSFTIFKKAKGFNSFINSLRTTPCDEAFIIVFLGDENNIKHGTMFVIKTSQIKIHKIRE